MDIVTAFQLSLAPNYLALTVATVCLANALLQLPNCVDRRRASLQSLFNEQVALRSVSDTNANAKAIESTGSHGDLGGLANPKPKSVP